MSVENVGRESVQRRRLPEGITQRLRGLMSELETAEREIGPELGQIELKVDENQALWFVAYKTVAQ